MSVCLFFIYFLCMSMFVVVSQHLPNKKKDKTNTNQIDYFMLFEQLYNNVCLCFFSLIFFLYLLTIHHTIEWMRQLLTIEFFKLNFLYISSEHIHNKYRWKIKWNYGYFFVIVFFFHFKCCVLFVCVFVCSCMWIKQQHLC